MFISKQLFRLIQAIIYDLVVLFFDSIIYTFFRDIKVRGSFNIPKTGPVIYVIAPHHNQFLDACVSIATTKEYGKRNVSFLIAAKSHRRPFIGLMSRLTASIPVERAQDMMRPGKGKIFLGEKDNVIIGEGTKFTKDCQVKGLIGLPKSKGNFQITEIVDDEKLIIKGSYEDKTESSTKVRYDLLKNGTSFKVAPHIDNHKLFQSVFDFLNEGNVLGLFPEGGSHDRTELLPLKPGVALMALGAMSQCKNSDQKIQIVPLGLNYFHPHRFRSRAVVEFGQPIEVTKQDGEEYIQDSRKAVGKLMDTISLKLKEVTINCDDYDTLMALQAARRLFTSGQRENIPLPMVVEMNRRLIKGYQMNKDKPDVIELKELVSEYNNKLRLFGLHDHQVADLNNSDTLSTLIKFLQRLFIVILFFILSLPGTVLFSPVFITAIRISRKKQKEALQGSVVKIKAKDVLGTWKVLVALVLAPALYIFYSICGTLIIVRKAVPDAGLNTKCLIFAFCYFWALLTTYASLRIGEIGIDYYKSLTPLFYSLVSEEKDIIQIEDLKKSRVELAKKVTEFCDRYGPSIFDDYEQFYEEYGEGDVNLDSALIFSDMKNENSSETTESEMEEEEIIHSKDIGKKITKRMRQRTQ